MAEGGSFDGAPERGACFNCGFLCHHSVADIHRSHYPELTYGARFIGLIFPEKRPDLVPWCYRQIHIMREINEAAAQEFPAYPEQRTAEWRVKENAAAVNVLGRDRQCALWYQYQPGDNPERHLDEYRMLELETQREKFEARISQANQKTQRWAIGIAAFQAIVAILALLAQTILQLNASPPNIQVQSPTAIIVTVVATPAPTSPTAGPVGIPTE